VIPDSPLESETGRGTALIVGAGIGGLAAGVALQRAGWRARIFERAATPRELGFALLLAPNALASLRSIGLADAVIAGGAIPNRGEIRGRKGSLLRSFDMTAVRRLLPEPIVVVLRPVLHGALLEAVGREALALESPVERFDIREGRPVVHLARGEMVEGDVLIGADGAGSIVRRLLHPNEGAPRPSGLWAVRGVAHVEPQVVADMPGSQYFGRGTEAGVSPASADAIYWYLSVTEDLVGYERDPLTIARRCASEFDDRLRAVVWLTGPEDARLDELLDRDPMEQWGRGPVTLLGDAAHPMLPHAGQGAAQALEDAVALASALGPPEGGPYDKGEGGRHLEAALRRYEAVRRARTKAIVQVARRNARVGSMRSAAGCWLRDLTIRIVPESQLLKAYVAFGMPPSLDAF
jgi:2-polyprenyl-6-methoxyphenol hydroxylase-like FAD-dependent oxidoreductase